ncbi:MAG: peptide chain release factor N(5)-glutamine methyltransferase [Kiritimatiellaeota bacterium]|nr:peptide chain release factor N(5)-glutamine methyltransferase [Kiritimatiellota bacterium]
MTIQNLLRDADAYLQKHGVDEARTVAELLVARLLKLPRLHLLTVLDHTLPEPAMDALRRGLQRAARHEPVQYILGEWDFRNLTLRVDRRALIPRPETELLVDWVLETEGIWNLPNPRVADIGTGTGCIILSIAAERPHAECVAVDASADALNLARENAGRLKFSDRVTFLQADACSEFQPASFDVLVSNPPYIASAEVATLPPHILDHEPRLALDGGKDGLGIIRKLLWQARTRLAPRGILVIETGGLRRAMQREFGKHSPHWLPTADGSNCVCLIQAENL